MTDDILYRGAFRLRKNNQEDETIYRFLESLPGWTKKNDVIKKALLEYIRNQTAPNQSDKIAPHGMEMLEKKLQGMEARLMDAIKTMQVAEPVKTREESKTDTIKEAEPESEIPRDALSFLANLNNGVQP